MSIKKKIVWLPYDMDTAIGINNEGELVFSYELEDTDHLAGGEDVYNGQKSVIWNNIRMAFADELRDMYQKLRSEGKLSYEVVEKAFEEHQAKWPEALFNEDSQFCYIDPLIYDEKDYLEMLQGSKEEQRKWWLYNRFRYIDSKYNAGDALSDLIQLRSYAKSDITITPYADIYPAVKFGSYLVSKRGKRNVATLLECPVDVLNDTETYIYSASQLASVGDLSGLKVGFADFSMATKLQSLKLGDSSNSYENLNLKTLRLGNNILLQTLDVRNCPALGSSDMKTVDISGCTGIRKVWFTGTQISGLTLPIGGVLDELALPATITNLTVRNQPKLTSFTFTGNDYSAVGTCRIENTDYFLKNQSWFTQILKAQASGGLKDDCRLRLVGLDIDWLADTDAISDFYDLFSRFRGLDITGGNLDDAYLEGTIRINSAKGSEIARLKQIFPYVNIVAEHTESYIYYYNGSTLVNTEKVLDGGNGTYAGTPTKTQDAQYTYTFAGWSKDDDNTVDEDATKAIVADRNVYACFTSTLRKYNVTFVKATADGGGTLQTISDVNYGTIVTAASAYTGETPTTTQGDAEDYPFEGWEPVSATVKGNTTFTAKFGSPVEIAEISDSWDTIITNIDNGTYKTKYKVGNYKPLDLGTEGTVNMQIVAIDGDELADGSGYAPLTFLGMELLKTKHRMSPSRSGSSGNYTNGTGAIGGWEKCEMRTYLRETIKPLIPSNVRSRINNVIKYSNIYDTAGNSVKNASSIDDVWIPSGKEIFNDSKHETQGLDYNKLFLNIENRKKTIAGTSTFAIWWLRTPSGSASYNYIGDTGYENNINASSSFYICLGFCLGYEQETITDDWSTILANPNYATDYSVGDTKAITINGERHFMQIVAFDADDMTAGGKAKISWLMKDQLNTTHRMNATSTNENGWPATEMRTWLRNTILPTIDSSIRSHIVDVNKTYYDYTDKTTETSSDNIWLASARELIGGTSYESSGPDYTALFTNQASRIKKRSGTAKTWWLRSANTSYKNSFNHVSVNGDISNHNSSVTNGVCIGFCTN